MLRVSDLVIKKAFKYSGNKVRLLQKCDFDIPECSRVVEPYMGSATFALSMGKEWLGIDYNTELIMMMEWLKTVSVSDLRDLLQYQGKRENVKYLPVNDCAKTYLRINISGVYVGQLNSWTIYPQHKLPVETTLDAIENLRKGTMYCGDAITYEPQEGDLVFIDPPYINTNPGYKTAKKSFELVNPKDILEFIDGLAGVNWIFTYGDNARELFPEIEWYDVYTKKVPNIHGGGGVVERIEHIAFNYKSNFVKRG